MCKHFQGEKNMIKNYEQLEEYKEELRNVLNQTTKLVDPAMELVIYPSISRTYELCFLKDKKQIDLDKNFIFYFEKEFKKISKTNSIISDGFYQMNYIDNRIYVSYPRKELDYKIASFHQEPVFQEALIRARSFGNSTGLSSIEGINNFIDTYGEVDLIQIGEAKMQMQMSKIIEMISKENIKFISISGPSCSGKTTTANKLRIGLMSVGLNPLRISLDDYYYLPSQCPLNPDGTRNLESIDSLDIKEFQKEMISLLLGKETNLRTFHFKDKTADFNRVAKLNSNQPIIIEGIHGLNPKLWEGIDPSIIFKIYISPQPQISITNLKPFPFSEARLLRRLVRDEISRSTSFEETFSMWSKVREEEFETIYAGEENANFVFDSFYPYELSVMKELATPNLMNFRKASPYYEYAQSLCNNLKQIKTIDIKKIPVNSTFREFIGGGLYKG